jgi:hypothetical protein
VHLGTETHVTSKVPAGTLGSDGRGHLSEVPILPSILLHLRTAGTPRVPEGDGKPVTWPR